MPITPVERTALYCPLCDQYFFDEASCAAHIQHSSNHPRCEPCGIRFANGHCLRQHLCDSQRHHFCIACRLEFQTAAGLRVHFEFAAVHRDDDDHTVIGDSPGWEDALGRRMYPDDVEQPADDDFDVAEPPAEERSYTVEELWDMDMNDDDDDLDLDEECEYDLDRLPALEMPITDADDLSAISALVVTGPISTEAHAAAKEAQDAANSAAEEENGTTPGARCHCPLCLEALAEPSATRCGHVFCTSCITSALDVKRSCPVCRTAAVPLQLRRLFLVD